MNDISIDIGNQLPPAFIVGTRETNAYVDVLKASTVSFFIIPLYDFPSVAAIRSS
jgi:hypothetical protein